MIITKLKPQDEILRYIGGYKRIFITGCGSCAKQCRTGGEADIRKMAEFLQSNGITVTGYVVPDETCHIPLVKRDLRQHKEEIDSSCAVLVMACGAGTAAVAESAGKRVYPACDTISLADTLRQGRFAGRCSLCGRCVLGDTAGICPVTRCPKGMLNGPCGGMDKGKCEVDREKECVWLEIYDELKRYNGTKEMRRIKEPKDYSKAGRGAEVRV